jgi:hypothetical protein
MFSLILPSGTDVRGAENDKMHANMEHYAGEILQRRSDKAAALTAAYAVRHPG